MVDIEERLKIKEMRNEYLRSTHKAELYLKELEAAVRASPSQIAVIVARDHKDNEPGGWHASQIKLPDGSRGWDHAAVAWMEDGKLWFGETRFGKGGLGPIYSKNQPGTAKELMTDYNEFKVLPINLTNEPPGARDRFVNAVREALKTGATYSAIGNLGDVCSSAIGKGFAAASENPHKSWWEKTTEAITKALSWNVGQAVKLNIWYTPNNVYLNGTSERYHVDFTFNPDASDLHNIPNFETALWLYPQETTGDASPAEGARTDGAAQQPATEDDQKASQEHALVSDTEDARTDDAAQQPETEDDEEASQEEVALVSDTEDARTDDAAQQPETDDDEDASQEQVATASDSKDARDDDDAETDDDEDASQEQVAIASDSKDARTDDAAVMETAKADVGVDLTADDQAVPQLAAASPVIPDDGFSFSAFPKQGVPIEVAKEAMPAERFSSEQSSSSEVPGSESVPEVGSEDVDNAAPSKQPVVHHGDLAP